MKKSKMYKKVSRKAKFFNHVNRNVVYPTIYFNANLEERNKNAVEITELNSDEDVVMSKNEQKDHRNNNHSWGNISYSSHERGDYKVNETARDNKRQNMENENHDTRNKYPTFNPTVYFNPNLEERNKNAVEITELNSDEDVVMSENEQQDHRNNNHSWGNTSYRSHEQGDYKVNETARDKKRQNMENKNHDTSSKYSDEDLLNQFCTDFYGIDCFDRGDSISTVNNLHSEFFTILNSHRTSQTSSDSNPYEEYDEAKENDCWNSNNFYDHRNVTYDNDGNEKRMIWIYSLKNPHYLSEHDYELINIASNNSISTTDDEEPSKDILNHRRIATPFPSYIPRMNLPLSPTLPTVTEVTEPNKLTSSISDIGTRKADKNLFQIPLSGWFKEETSTENVNHSPGNTEQSYDNNWHALSSREKRRLRQSKISEQNNLNTKKDSETPIYCKPKIISRYKEFSPESHIEQFETQIDESNRNEDDQENYMNDEKEVSLENSRDSTSLCNLETPQIKRSTEMKTLKKNTTYLIEKLDGKWIGQSLPENYELLEVNNYVMGPENNDAQVASQETGDAIEECDSYRLFMRNMSVLKPTEWTQYSPLNGSMRVPSLHLSTSGDNDFDTEKKSWFKRFLDIVNCCK
ncbi:GATA zinc finger domain-containing protein 14-like [Maniola jurtina]|uniref:GATA zinc finger domain-containing protein 14-like n=1 Tax=Maniola jurtina TaxID=191418 RepID=UPI001E68E855|nr:GATA zinc finger domain-containing protein 14-like [Maniola jurtina]